jgi:hypothetical protein
VRTLRVVVVLIVSCGLCGIAVGQQLQPRPHNMTGCLQKTPDGKNFMLTQNNKKTVEFSKSSVDLTPHIGHQIQITGTTDAEREAKEGGQQNGHYMEVSAVKVIVPHVRNPPALRRLNPTFVVFAD